MKGRKSKRLGFGLGLGLNQVGEKLTWSRLLASQDKSKKATEKKGLGRERACSQNIAGTKM